VKTYTVVEMSQILERGKPWVYTKIRELGIEPEQRVNRTSGGNRYSENSLELLRRQKSSHGDKSRAGQMREREYEWPMNMTLADIAKARLYEKRIEEKVEPIMDALTAIREREEFIEKMKGEISELKKKVEDLDENIH